MSRFDLLYNITVYKDGMSQLASENNDEADVQQHLCLQLQFCKASLQNGLSSWPLACVTNCFSQINKNKLIKISLVSLRNQNVPLYNMAMATPES